jgi:hypothetical protein
VSVGAGIAVELVEEAIDGQILSDIADFEVRDFAMSRDGAVTRLWILFQFDWRGNVGAGELRIGLPDAAGPRTVPVHVRWPATQIGGTPLAMPVAVWARDGAPVTGVSVTGENAADVVVRQDECTGAPVVRGEPCWVWVRFDPQAPGTRRAALHVIDEAGHATDVPLEVFAYGGDSSYRMVSEPGEWVGRGLTWEYGPTSYLIPRGTRQELHLTVLGALAVDQWELYFMPPAGGTLDVGTYDGAVYYLDASDGPGMDVSGTGRGCRHISGSFTIHELAFVGPEITHLRVSFEMRLRGDRAGPARDVRMARRRHHTRRSMDGARGDDADGDADADTHRDPDGVADRDRIADPDGIADPRRDRNADRDSDADRDLDPDRGPDRLSHAYADADADRARERARPATTRRAQAEGGGVRRDPARHNHLQRASASARSRPSGPPGGTGPPPPGTPAHLPRRGARAAGLTRADRRAQDARPCCGGGERPGSPASERGRSPQGAPRSDLTVRTRSTRNVLDASDAFVEKRRNRRASHDGSRRSPDARPWAARFIIRSLGTDDYPRADAEWDRRRGRQAAGRPDRGLDPPSVSGTAVGSGSMDSAGGRTGGSTTAPVVVGSRSRRSDADRHDSRAADRQALGVRRGSETIGIAGFNAGVGARRDASGGA